MVSDEQASGTPDANKVEEQPPANPAAPAPAAAKEIKTMATKNKKAAKKNNKKAAKKARKPAGEPRGEKTLKIKSMLERKSGCTRAQVLEATGWKAVSMQQMAKACGLKLRQEKEKGKPTTYFGS